MSSNGGGEAWQVRETKRLSSALNSIDEDQVPWEGGQGPKEWAVAQPKSPIASLLQWSIFNAVTVNRKVTIAQ